MMPLSTAEIGQENLIKRIGGKPEAKKRIESLGFVPGSKVSVVTRIGENVIVQIKESRIALSREMAQNIFI
jgi:ferrous iron transport protein A